MTYEREALFDKAIGLFRKGKIREAFNIIKELVENTDSSIYEVEPRYLFYYGYLTGIVDHNYKRAIDLCNEALKKEAFHTDFYLYLAKLYILVNNKNMALKLLHGGLKIDNTNQEIISLIKELGIRRKPVFPFLRRDNPVNKVAGKLRSSFLRLVKGER
ncbi:MAG: tetratricopeptide repeat protein [bacterium]